MRDRRRQRPVARAAPVAYYVSIPRREGRAQFLATISTHITINGVRMPMDRPRTVLADDTVCIDTVIVATENGPRTYAMRDFEPTPSGGKIG